MILSKLLLVYLVTVLGYSYAANKVAFLFLLCFLNGILSKGALAIKNA